MDRGFTIVSGGTDNHSMLVDLRTKYPDLTGKMAENALVAADITVNKNMVPFDSRSAFQTSGIRLGTAAITTRGAKEDLMNEIAEMIEMVLNAPNDESVIAKVKERVNTRMKDYPLLIGKTTETKKQTQFLSFQTRYCTFAHGITIHIFIYNSLINYGKLQRTWLGEHSRDVQACHQRWLCNPRFQLQ